MSVLRPRKRLVYFRLSEDEFQRAASLCEASGARSISDLARLAVEEFLKVAAGDRTPVLDTRLRDLDRILSELNERLRELTCALQVADGNSQEQRTAIVES